MTDYLTDAEINIKTYLETHDIPTYFYQCFFGELVKVFGVGFLIPDKYYDVEYDYDGNRIEYDDKLYAYKKQIEYYCIEKVFNLLYTMSIRTNNKKEQK